MELKWSSQGSGNVDRIGYGSQWHRRLWSSEPNQNWSRGFEVFGSSYLEFNGMLRFVRHLELQAVIPGWSWRRRRLVVVLETRYRSTRASSPCSFFPHHCQSITDLTDAKLFLNHFCYKSISDPAPITKWQGLPSTSIIVWHFYAAQMKRSIVHGQWNKGDDF